MSSAFKIGTSITKKQLEEAKEKLKKAGLEKEKIKKILENLKNNENELKKMLGKTPEKKKEPETLGKKPKTLEDVLKNVDTKINDKLSKYDTLYITTMAAEAVFSEEEIKKAGKELSKYQILGQILTSEINGKSYVNLDPEAILNDYLEPAKEAIESDEVKKAVQGARMVYASKVAELILNKPEKIKNDKWGANAAEVISVLEKPGVKNALKKQLNGYGKDLKGFELYFSVYLREKGLAVEEIAGKISEIKRVKQGANAFSLMDYESNKRSEIK